MFLSLVVEFNERPTGPAGGDLVYAWFLGWLRGMNTGWSEAMHRDGRHKPFTVSPLLSSGGRPFVRITSLEPELSLALAALRPDDAGGVRLGRNRFTVRMTTADPRQHPWAGHADSAALWSTCSRPLVSTATLRFHTPTAFGDSGRRASLQPDPRLVFSSLARRWAACSSVPDRPGDLPAVAHAVRATRFDVKTRTAPLRRFREVGFVGCCEFTVDSSAPVAVRQWFHVLCRFAVFSGVGQRTTMGMGQTSLVAVR
jgi:CRISPR-associated endoribonuclease Cas6